MDTHMDSHENSHQISLKRKRSDNDDEDDFKNNNGPSNNRLLLLRPSPSLFHAENVPSSPYGAKDASKETLYLPLNDTIFINTQVYDEILLRDGQYYVADEKGVYDKTVEGVSFNFLKYNDVERRMLITRSFLCTTREKANEISNYLTNR